MLVCVLDAPRGLIVVLGLFPLVGIDAHHLQFATPQQPQVLAVVSPTPEAPLTNLLRRPELRQLSRDVELQDLAVGQVDGRLLADLTDTVSPSQEFGPFFPFAASASAFSRSAFSSSVSTSKSQVCSLATRVTFCVTG